MKLNKRFELNKQYLSSGIWVNEFSKYRIFFLNSIDQYSHYIRFKNNGFIYVINSYIYENRINIEYEEY